MDQELVKQTLDMLRGESDLNLTRFACLVSRIVRNRFADSDDFRLRIGADMICDVVKRFTKVVAEYGGLHDRKTSAQNN